MVNATEKQMELADGMAVLAAALTRRPTVPTYDTTVKVEELGASWEAYVRFTADGGYTQASEFDPGTSPEIDVVEVTLDGKEVDYSCLTSMTQDVIEAACRYEMRP